MVFSIVVDKHGSLPLQFPVQCSRKTASSVCAGLVCKVWASQPNSSHCARSLVLFGMALLQFLCLHQFCPWSNKANYCRGVPHILILLSVTGIEWGRLWDIASCPSAKSHCKTEMWVTAVP